MTLHEAPLETPFAVLAASPCAPCDAMLTAIEREFAAVDRARLADALDTLARPLFGLAAASARERSMAFAAAAYAALPADGSDPDAWLISRALEQRRAAPPVRAVLAAELARRAGVDARPARFRGRWLVGVHDRGAPVGADVGADDRAGDWDVCSGCLCGHEVAFLVLGGLAAAWRAAGERERARRAAGLRLLLPLGDDLRTAVREDVARYGRPQ
jgi:Transglutaminase-like superfamily